MGASPETEAALKLQQSVMSLMCWPKRRMIWLADCTTWSGRKMLKSKDSKVGTPSLFNSATRISVRHIKVSGQMIEDYISQTETVGNDRQDGTRQKRRRVSSRSCKYFIQLYGLAQHWTLFHLFTRRYRNVIASICSKYFSSVSMIKFQEVCRIALVQV
jgi:hypothetical protein